MFRKTKIVCTLGPASADEATIEKMLLSGMSIARLNFSHGTHESHADLIEKLRKVSAKLDIPVAIMQDLCGPKIRLGKIEDGAVTLSEGDIFKIYDTPILGTKEGASVNIPNLSKELKVGDHLLIDDGVVGLRVEQVRDGFVEAVLLNSGTISSGKGVNLPSAQLSIPSLTPKDLDDLRFGIEQKVDFVAISFVRSAADLQPALDLMHKLNCSIPIISKIEKPEAVQNIESILEKSYGIMVARGDLGVEMPFEKLPAVQKKLISVAADAGKPVITATQMLDSMIRNPVPTRAEVTDVANAIFDGTDAVMLSGETASGAYPIEAVRAMAKIALAAEKELPYSEVIHINPVSTGSSVDILSLVACEMAYEMKAEAIVSFTSSGRSAQAISNYRPSQIVVAATETEEVARKMLLSWGTYPVVIKPGNFKQKLSDTTAEAISNNYVADGDLIVVTAALPDGLDTSTNSVLYLSVNSSVLRGSGLGVQDKATGRAVIADAHDRLPDLQNGDIAIVSHYASLADIKGVQPKAAIIEKAVVDKKETADFPVVHGAVGAKKSIASGSTVTVDAIRGIVTYGDKTADKK